VKTLVLLHGWAMTPAVFDDLAARLAAVCTVHAIALPGYCGAAASADETVASLAASIAARAPRRCVVAGWSLGGQVALEWARSRPQQVEALALIAATPSFVQRDGWPHAVERGVFDAFGAALHASRERALERFASLQAQGEPAMKTVLARLRRCICGETDASTVTLEGGLRVLLETDLREAPRDIVQEALVIHGECDRLAPLAAAEALAQRLERGSLRTITGAAHAPFVSRPDAVAQALKTLL
jgi:pimeloyl-[acyl-carrier protein] methyl ester esterase